MTQGGFMMIHAAAGDSSLRRAKQRVRTESAAQLDALPE